MRSLKENLGSLLIALPRPMFQTILSSYPGIKNAARMGFDEKLDVDEHSVVVVAVLLSDFIINGLPAATRQQIVTLLRDASYEQPSVREANPSAALWAKVIASTLAIVDLMAKNGKVDNSRYEYFVNEVFGALDGQTPKERSRADVARIVNDILASNK